MIRKMEEFRIKCLMCGKTDNLMMFAHRPKDDKDRLVGFVFLCKGCHELYPDIELSVIAGGEDE